MLPGVDILSTYRGGGYATSSGTSMASPHAAGLAALQIAAVGRAQNTAEVYAIRQALIDQGKSWTSSEGLQLPSPPSPNPDSPDKHMENLGWAGPAGEVNLPPAVSIDSPLAGETLSGNATVTVTVTDVDPITSVQFFVDGVLASTDTDGTDGWGFQWDTTLAAEGTRSLMVVATDERGATGSDSLEVIVDNVVFSGMHVSDLDGSAVAEGPRHWVASVTITVIDDGGEPVAGGTVSGSWSGGTTGSTSAVTDAAGQAVVSSDRIRDKSPTATWTVNAITHPSITYIASENRDSDGDSDGTSIEVQRSTAAGNQPRAAVPRDAFATKQEPSSEESVREVESVVSADASLRGKTAKSRSFRGQADAADPRPTEANTRVEHADSAPVSNELGSWQRGVDAALAVERELS